MSAPEPEAEPKPKPQSSEPDERPPESRALEFCFDIDAPVEAVWACFTNAQELTRWFPPQARVSPGEGGSVWMSWDGEYEGEMNILLWEPPHRLALGYGTQGPDGKPASLVQAYRFEASGKGTRLLLRHAGFGCDPSWDALYDGTRRGWEFELRGLRHYLQHHRGVSRHVIHARRVVPHGLAVAWKKLWGPRGLSAHGDLESSREGDGYGLESAAGVTLTGMLAMVNPPTDLAATVAEANGAFLRVRLDAAASSKEHSEVNLWLSTYGVEENRRKLWREQFQGVLDAVFPDATASP